jgi:hypothetical protein
MKNGLDGAMSCVLCCTCRVLDAMYRGNVQPGIFMRDEMDHYTDLMKDATDKFEDFHQKTYLGHDTLRRLSNTKK